MEKKNKLLLFLVFILVIILCIALYLNYNLYYKDYSYVKTSTRTSAVIKIANESYLDFYINKKVNTLVVFWASWCPDCKAEANDLNNFITNNQDIPVIIVSHDTNIDTLNNYLSENNFNWFVIYDRNKTIREHIAPGTSGIPSSYLLDTNGNVINSRIENLTEDMFLQFYNQEI